MCVVPKLGKNQSVKDKEGLSAPFSFSFISSYNGDFVLRTVAMKHLRYVSLIR